MSEIAEYVVGFLFDARHQHVVLIEKNRPAWQRGQLNGVGGRIEENETPAAAMRREFHEEAGLLIDTWSQFAKLTGAEVRVPDAPPIYIVHFFCATAALLKPQSNTDERVGCYDIASLSVLPCVPNLRWLIPMAVSVMCGAENANRFDIYEEMV